MRDDRPRGIRVFPMPRRVCGPFDTYALLVRKDGAVMMVHSEGVGYPVRDDKPWRWNDFDDKAEVFGPGALLVLAGRVPVGDSVDLADWVRTFGARLENNFHQIRHWALDA